MTENLEQKCTANGTTPPVFQQPIYRVTLSMFAPYLFKKMRVCIVEGDCQYKKRNITCLVEKDGNPELLPICNYPYEKIKGYGVWINDND